MYSIQVVDAAYHISIPEHASAANAGFAIFATALHSLYALPHSVSDPVRQSAGVQEKDDNPQAGSKPE